MSRPIMYRRILSELSDSSLAATPLLGPAISPSSIFSGPVPAPAPIPSLKDLLGDCSPNDITCYKTSVSDHQITQTLWICTIILAAFTILFCLLRNRVRIYSTRLYLGTVWIQPPEIRTSGFHKYWSWLWMLFKTSDAQVAQSCGMDSLVFSKCLAMIIQIIFYGTALGMIIVLPTVLSGNRIDKVQTSDHLQAATSTFARLTISNLPRGSPKYWLIVIFLFLFIGGICYMLSLRYKEVVALRQKYMSGGEYEMNEWHNETEASEEDNTRRVMCETSKRPSQPGTVDQGPNLLRPMSSHVFSWQNTRTEILEQGNNDPEQLPTPGHRRRVSEIKREELVAAGLSPRDETANWKTASKFSKVPLDKEFTNDTKSSKTPDSVCLKVVSNGIEGQAGSRISPFERNPPTNDTEHDNFCKWWKASEKSKEPEKHRKIGKPNVSRRKSIYSLNPDGSSNERHLVNAQNYAVLVTDVPDIVKGKRRRTLREQRAGKFWAVWYRMLGFVNYWILMRKDKDKKTGDLIIPTNKYMGETPRTARARLAAENSPFASDSPKKIELVETSPSKEPSPKKEIRLKIDDFDSSKEQGAFLETANRSGSVTPAQLDDEELKDGEDLVQRTFQNLFPESFDGLIAVRNHKTVDSIIEKCNEMYVKLQRAEADYQDSFCTKRPILHPGRKFWKPWTWCDSKEEDAIDFYANQIRTLEEAIRQERKLVFDKRPKSAFFVFFTSAQDAAMAAQSKIHSESGHSFRTQAAPGPEEVMWQPLWIKWWWRELRGLISLVLLAMILLVPIGLASGSLNQLTLALCSNGPANKWYSQAYCGRSSIYRTFVTGILPPVLLTLIQMFLLPQAAYRLAVFKMSSYSMSDLDRHIGMTFFLYAVFNVFLGVVLGGSLFGQIGTVLKDPKLIAGSVGYALPQASNFFISYITIQAFVTQILRLLVPHAGALAALWRTVTFKKTRTDIERFNALSPHSIRYGREVGNIMLILLVAIVYSASSPIILPITLFFCITAWVQWKYSMLYVNERCFESGGRIWELVFTCIMWILFLAELFTGTVLMANGAYSQASVLWVVTTPLLYKFNSFCTKRYSSAIRHMPLELAVHQPPAHVTASTYLPPALKEGCNGWHPETGKAWENFGMPRYGVEWPAFGSK